WMPPTPFSIALTTQLKVTATWSRLLPSVPFAPAATIVWHFAQNWTKTFLPLAAFPGPLVLAVLPFAASAGTTIMTAATKTRATRPHVTFDLIPTQECNPAGGVRPIDPWYSASGVPF